MKVMFLIRSLNRGGAERYLVELAKGLRKRGHEMRVVTFYPEGEFREELLAADVEVLDLGKRGRWDLVPMAIRLSKMIAAWKPSVLYTWMPAENLSGSLMKMRHRRLKVVWAIQSAWVRLDLYDLPTRLLYRLEPFGARFADAIVANSRAGAETGVARGMPREKMEIIRNGVDCERFVFSPDRGARLRERWGIPPGHRVVGIVGRLDPVKDHETFVRAAAIVAERERDVEFVCIGAAEKNDLARLLDLARGLSLGERFRWVGPSDDMPAAYSALDLLALSSVAEGMPNVVTESMACGIPAVVTDVGDCRDLVEDSRFVVPPRSPEALAGAMLEALKAAGDDQWRYRLRQRCLREFRTDRLVAETETLFRRLKSGEGD
jgi:glycosyltransferase involved in cell wall biosynthesis